MSETAKPNLSGVAGTSLITLCLRAMASQRRDAPMKDERADAVVRQLARESLPKTLPPTKDPSREAVISKTREFDRFTQDFLARRSRMPPRCSNRVIACAWLADDELSRS